MVNALGLYPGKRGFESFQVDVRITYHGVSGSTAARKPLVQVRNLMVGMGRGVMVAYPVFTR